MKEEEEKSNFEMNLARDRNSDEMIKDEDLGDRFSYCLIIPFPFKEDLDEAKEQIENSRGLADKWFVDKLIISEKDFKKLLSKSNKISLLKGIDKLKEKEEGINEEG